MPFCFLGLVVDVFRRAVLECPGMSLTQNVELVRRRIQQACERAGRPASSVTLIAVTKGIPLETIREAVALGLTDLGENRVQEASDKRKLLDPWLGGLAPSPRPVRWHLIGHLQRNKAKAASELFDVIHSVDSLRLVEALKEAAGYKRPAADNPLEVFIQVNISGEPTKFGCRLEEAHGLAQAVSRVPRLKLSGLMTIAPFSPDPEHARPHFRCLRQLRDDLSLALSLQPSALGLSMGMSQDFEVAIEEGADLVRIGTTIFGS